MTKYGHLPTPLRVSFRVTDIMMGARPLDFTWNSPALLYLQSLAPDFDLRNLDQGALREHPALTHWASRSGSMPALILRGRRTSVDKNSAALCIFLTRDGRLASHIKAPRLWCGVLDGSICVLKEGRIFTYFCETLETALKIISAGTNGRVAHVMRRENIGEIASTEPWDKRFFIYEAARGTDERLLSALASLCDQGTQISLLSSENALSVVAWETASE